ncbi:hypothetical protein [Cysteiniphilum litorale]|uniref:hypothetical protein n=1 Tax=Cysteiniphilum litorale TaxID=2056700 RepID=UPI003F884168
MTEKGDKGDRVKADIRHAIYHRDKTLPVQKTEDRGQMTEIGMQKSVPFYLTQNLNGQREYALANFSALKRITAQHV